MAPLIKAPDSRLAHLSLSKQDSPRAIFRYLRLDALLRVPAATLRQPGTLPWYGAEYAVDDLIVYTAYGHKREHSAQIAVYRDLYPQPSLPRGR